MSVGLAIRIVFFIALHKHFVELLLFFLVSCLKFIVLLRYLADLPLDLAKVAAEFLKGFVCLLIFGFWYLSHTCFLLGIQPWLLSRFFC